MQSTSWEMLGWMKHKLESRLLSFSTDCFHQTFWIFHNSKSSLSCSKQHRPLRSEVTRAKSSPSREWQYLNCYLKRKWTKQHWSRPPALDTHAQDLTGASTPERQRAENGQVGGMKDHGFYSNACQSNPLCLTIQDQDHQAPKRWDCWNSRLKSWGTGELEWMPLLRPHKQKAPATLSS